MIYNIAEIFLSIQGEGAHVGRPVVFVRFSGCNLSCSFCDTPHDVSPKEMTSEMITQAVYNVCFEKGIIPVGIPCVFTGGEPLLQVDLPLLMSVRNLQMPCHLETNGSLSAVRSGRLYDTDVLHEALSYFDEVTVSPKVEPLSQDVLIAADTIKVLIPFTDSFTLNGLHILTAGPSYLKLKNLIFQPITPRSGIDSWEWRNHVAEAISLAIDRKRLYNENWRVIPQTHILMKVR
jgi:organic radical activating enzyme